jgi:hypothetical protein
MTKSYATLVVSRATFDEIYGKLRQAKYDHCLVGNIRVNLDEIGLMPEDEFEPSRG